MKLIRFGKPGKEKPGLLIGEKMWDMSSVVADYNEAFFANNEIEKLKRAIGGNDSFLEVDADVRLGSPIARPSKIICIGLNYVDHCIETNAPIPTEPIIFFKSTTALCGPNDNLVIPKNSTKTDWEVELAFVMGKKASYVEEADAMNFVAGYCLHNDYSERAYQLERGGQWVKGKSCDHFAPLGPWLITKDEVPNPQNLHMWTKLNGENVQDSTTGDMIFDCNFIVYYLSHFMTLLPGDVISTGTPSGVGMGRKPQRFVREGDVIEIGIDLLGVSRQIAKNVVISH